MFLVAPSEPADLKTGLGAISTPALEDLYGIDVAFWAGGKFIGVQRKRFPEDLVASLRDGRLASQIPKMTRLDHAAIILEGRANWSRDGRLVHGWANLDRRRFRALCWSLTYGYGIAVYWTQDIADTVDSLQAIRSWFGRPESSWGSILIRPKPRSQWSGEVDADQLEYFLEGLPGVSRGRARMILQHIGRVPFSLDVDLRKVRGIGKVTARRIEEFLATQYPKSGGEDED